jgi:YfiH family protein
MNFIKPDWPAPANIKAYTTVRSSWNGPKNDPALISLLQLPEEPIWVRQTHSHIALNALPENKHLEADATYTDQTNRVCAVLTADCLPVLVCNKQGTHVAAIHAGWRGLASGVIETTLQHLNLPANDILIWLGPAIGPKKFEVGQDVFDAFTLQHPDTASAFTPHTPGKWLANLYELAKIRLASQGISQIYGGNFCTFTQDELFFSYRRDKGLVGRMASVIWK